MLLELIFASLELCTQPIPDSLRCLTRLLVFKYQIEGGLVVILTFYVFGADLIAECFLQRLAEFLDTIDQNLQLLDMLGSAQPPRYGYGTIFLTCRGHESG